MAYNIQVTVDSINPLGQADWWAETLGWIVEPTDQAFVDDMLAKGYAKPEDLVEHNGARVWRDGAAICKEEEVHRKGRLRILFQPVPEPKTVKDRVHLDIHVEDGDKDALRTALESRGATFSYQANQGPFIWYTMLDPEGNEFCIG